MQCANVTVASATSAAAAGGGAGGGGGGGGGGDTACATLHTGGVFTGASAQISMSVLDMDCPIKYTEDGTAPTENSVEYMQPIEITANTTFKAALVCDGADPTTLFVSTLVFTRR